jgi:hypothetical protein
MAAVQILPEKRQRRGGHFTVSSAVCGRLWRRSMVAKVWVLSSEPTCSLRACVIRGKLRHPSTIWYVGTYLVATMCIALMYIHTIFLSCWLIIPSNGRSTLHFSLGALNICHTHTCSHRRSAKSPLSSRRSRAILAAIVYLIPSH